MQVDPPSSHQTVSHQGPGLRATEGPLRSHPKATYVPSWTWQALRVTSQLDLKTTASSMNFNSPLPNSLPPQAKRAQFRLPHQRIPFIETSKAVPFGPSTIHGLGEERREGKCLEYLLCCQRAPCLQKGLSCIHTLSLPLGLKQEFGEAIPLSTWIPLSTTG